ncbi:MAG: TolC family outer membrane protein [Halothiobacillus sp.]
MNNPRRALRLKHPLILLAIGFGAAYGLPALADQPVTNLVEIVNLAAQNDQTLKAADQSRMAILENRPIAQSSLLPQISGVAGANYNRTDVQYGGLATAPKTIKGPSSNLGINLNQVIYNRIDNLNLGIADLQAKQAELDYAAAQQNLILRAAQAYFAVLKANAGLQLAIASQNAFKNQLAQAQKRYEVGLIAVTDVANAQANFDKANADIITNRNALQNAKAALATLTNQEPDELSDIQTNLATPHPNPENLDNWTTLAVKQNITLQSAEIGGQIVQENIALNRAAAAPTVNLIGQYGYNTAPSQFNGNQTGNLAGSIGVQVAVPLYTGGRINAKSRQAAFQYQQTQNQIENLRRLTQQGTANDYRGVLTALSEITAYSQAVESARTSLAATQAGYQVGTRTIVDVLNAQTLVFSAMANFLNARYNYLVSALQLKADTGQLAMSDIEAINAQLVPGKVNALIAPLMQGASESPQAEQKMIERVMQRAKQTVNSDSK